MPEKYTYLLVNLGCLIVPLIFSFHPRLRFYREWKGFILPCILTAAFFLAWDVLFTCIGVWWFNEQYVLGYYWQGLPLEEYLFFFCIPFACVFSYHAFTVLWRFDRWQKPVRIFYLLLAVSLLIIALFNAEKLYTSVTFCLLAAMLFGLVWKNPPFLPAFFFCYLFILLPFVISNGVLTGSFFNRVVVFYNDQHNLGIRLLTIPIEDMFYGMLLLLLNVTGFERYTTRASKLAAPAAMLK